MRPETNATALPDKTTIDKKLCDAFGLKNLTPPPHRLAATSTRSELTTAEKSRQNRSLVLYLGRDPARRAQNLAEARPQPRTPSPPLPDLQLQLQHHLQQHHPAHSFRGQLQPRLQQKRVTTAQLLQRQSVIERTPANQLRLRRTINRHISDFGGDVSRTLTALTLVMKGTTVVRYAAALARDHPELSSEVAPYINYGRKMAATVRGRPVQAPRFAVEDFAKLLHNLQHKPLIRDALILLFASASRAADLQHFDPEPVTDHHAQVWRIRMVVTEEEDGGLHAPKSDRNGTKRISKWIPQHSLITLHRLWPHYRDLYPVMKQIGCTPHSIRGTAIKTLEEWGYPETQITCLTCHAMQTSVAHYSSLTVNDPGARMALEMSHRLLTLLQTTMALTSPSSSTTGMNPPSF
jgi:hypothetical protein